MADVAGEGSIAFGGVVPGVGTGVAVGAGVGAGPVGPGAGNVVDDGDGVTGTCAGTPVPGTCGATESVEAEGDGAGVGLAMAGAGNRDRQTPIAIAAPNRWRRCVRGN